jgi:basic amino acid/polyamine antiporter, APA family
MSMLARKLRITDYFALAWGTMVGVGWLVVMDDWLTRGGPLGGVLGFAIGGTMLIPIAYVYGRLVIAMPDAASEVAYTAKVFPPLVSFATGWMMVLAYFIVCPWEAIALGRIAAYIFPSLDSMQLYSIAGRPIFLPHLVLGLVFTALLTILNYRGIHVSATFQSWATFATLALFVIFITFGASKGSPRNFAPLFTHAPFVSVLLVLQVVPYYMTGFESVTKAAEEASPDFNARAFSKAIWLAVIVGVLFYTTVIAAVGYVAPWKQLVGERFMTAVAFENAVGSRSIVNIILATAFLSLCKVSNGNFVAATRLLFAMGRRGLMDGRLSWVQPTNQTPSIAVICVGIATAGLVFLGDGVLVPISEVGSVASAAGWLAACASYYRLRGTWRNQLIAGLGIMVAMLMILMKIVPTVPGHFTSYEWLSLGIWSVVGIVLRRRKGTRSP